MIAGKYVVNVNEAGQIMGQPQAYSEQPQTVQNVIDPTAYYVGAGIFFLIILPTIWALAILPRWRVWAQRKQGEADLEQAHKEQKIQVAQANSRLEAAEANKKAAIVEAEAVSAQIEKIGKQLTEHDLYLKWQWIKMMEEKPENSVIYVPTEAGMPILEAGKRRDKKVEKAKEDEE